MAGAPVPGGQRGSMKFDGFTPPPVMMVTPTPSVEFTAHEGQLSNGVVTAPPQVMYQAQPVPVQPQAQMMIPSSTLSIPELPPTLGNELMCAFAFLKDGNIQYTKPFLASDYEFQVIREYVREWADEQRLQAVMEFAQPSTTCVYRVPERKGTTMEELVRRMREHQSVDAQNPIIKNDHVDINDGVNRQAGSRKSGARSRSK